jgi:hypothetical protein
MVETLAGVQDSGGKSSPSMIYWYEWAREENAVEDLAMIAGAFCGLRKRQSVERICIFT